MSAERTQQRASSGHRRESGSARHKRNQARAGRFRSRNETSRKIKLIDVYGNARYVKSKGKLNVTKHHKVLTALEKR